MDGKEKIIKEILELEAVTELPLLNTREDCLGELSTALETTKVSAGVAEVFCYAAQPQGICGRGGIYAAAGVYPGKRLL